MDLGKKIFLLIVCWWHPKNYRCQGFSIITLHLRGTSLGHRSIRYCVSQLSYASKIGRLLWCLFCSKEIKGLGEYLWFYLELSQMCWSGHI